MAGGRTRHPRRRERQRVGLVGGRAPAPGAHGEPAAEVHARRALPDADRSSGPEPGESRHREPEQRRGHVRVCADERAVRCRRVREPPRDRVRRRHGSVQAHVGCVRRTAERRRVQCAEVRGTGRAAVQHGARHSRVRRRARLCRGPTQQPHPGLRPRRHVPAGDLRRAGYAASRHRVLDRLLTGCGAAVPVPRRRRERPHPHLRSEDARGADFVRPHRPVRGPVRVPPQRGRRLPGQRVYGGGRDRSSGSEVHPELLEKSSTRAEIVCSASAHSSSSSNTGSPLPSARFVQRSNDGDARSDENVTDPPSGVQVG